MRTLTRVGALSAVAAAAVLSAPAAHATDTYTVELRQQLPRTATTADGGAPQQGREQCPGVPDGQDGWHFVLPANSTDFVRLTVTFQPGGQQVVTDFGPPSDKHAYVWSQPGAELTSAVAEVRGGDLELFNLSHTCPATTSTTPGGSDEDENEDGSGNDDETGNESGTTPSATPSETTEATDAPSASPSEAAAAPSSAPSPQGDTPEGDLAETGNGAPVGLLSGVAAALLAAGGYLMYRRRKA